MSPVAKRSFPEAVAVARLYEELSRPDEALAWFQRALKHRPRDGEIHRRGIQLLRDQGSTEDLLDAYGAWERASPRDAAVALDRASAALERGKRDLGLRLLKAVRRRFPRDAGVHQRSVDLLVRHGGSRAEIEKITRRLITLEPREPGHVISLGEIHWSAGKRSDAVATWRALIALEVRPGQGHLRFAEVLAEHGQNQDARRHFEEAMAAAPDDPRISRPYARWLDRQGEAALGAQIWQKVLESTREDPGRRPWAQQARQRIVAQWKRSGQLPGQKKRLRADVDRIPPDMEAGRMLTEILLEEGRWNEAEALLVRLRKSDPESLDLLDALEALYTQTGQDVAVLGVLEEVAARRPLEASEALSRSARIALRMGDTERALELARRFQSDTSSGSQAAMIAGEVFERLGMLKDAAAAYSTALSVRPADHDLSLRLAGIYRRLGDWQREESLLVRMVRESLDPSQVQQAGRRLLEVAGRHDRLEFAERVLSPLVAYGGRRRDTHLRLLVDVHGAIARRARWSPGAEEMLADLGQRALEPLLDAVLSTDTALRARALGVLEVTRTPGAVPALTRLLRDADPKTRLKAAAALGRIGSSSAVTALLRLAGTGAGGIRQAAIWALGLRQGSEAEQGLVSLHGLEPSDVPLWLLALGMQKGDHSAPLLGLHLIQGRSLERTTALWAIAWQAHPSSVEALTVALDQPMRRRHKVPSRAGSPYPGEAGYRLAAWGLGRIGTPEARQVLLDRLWRGTHESRDRAIWAGLLAPTPSDATIARLRGAYGRLVEGAGPRGRTNTGPLTSWIPSPGNMELLPSALLAELSPLLAERLETALPEHATRLLRATLAPNHGLCWPGGDPDGVSPEMTRRVATALAPVLPSLYWWIRQGEADLASVALEVASRVALLDGGEEREQVLSSTLAAFDRPEARVRQGALSALARLARPGLDGALASVLAQLAALSEEDWYGRAATGRALVGIAERAHAPGATGPLTLLAAHGSREVRLEVAVAAGRLCDPALRPALMELEADRVADVAQAAREALICQTAPQVPHSVDGLGNGF